MVSKKKPPTKKAGPTLRSTEPIAVVFGSERLLSLWCRRNAFNPRRAMLATHGNNKLQGHTGAVITVRFPKEYWKPATFPCETRVKEVEDAIKRHKKEGGELIEYKES